MKAACVTMACGRRLWALRFAVGTLLLVLSASSAWAGVRLEGDWPEGDKSVSLEADHLPRAEAVKRLADAAGWSLVVSTTSKNDMDLVDVHVKDQPAAKVLSLVLSDGDFVAKREGNLVLLRADDGSSSAQAGHAAAPSPAAEPPAPPSPPPPPAPVKRGEDRTVTGGSLKIRRDEVVHDVSVFGGSVDVYGTVTGDLAVMGGRAEVHEGAHIVGSATTVGGSLHIRDGARVDGDVGVVGGSLRRDDKAQVGGSIVQGTSNDDDEEGPSSRHGKHGSLGDGFFSHVFRAMGEAFSHAAILFVFGTIVIALGSKRVESLRVEVASRPMRAFALGVVGLIASIALVTALCVTIVGIPVAIVGVLTGAVAAYVGVAAVVATLGEGLLRHRTENPYVHLAFGCALLFIVGAIPYVGSVAEAFVAFAGIGVIVATRAAGLVPPRSNGGRL
jgi:hypothetical protein